MARVGVAPVEVRVVCLVYLELVGSPRQGVGCPLRIRGKPCELHRMLTVVEYLSVIVVRIVLGYDWYAGLAARRSLINFTIAIK